MSSSDSGTPLILVSNRGPVTFGPDGEIRRGTGGLVTALIGLASHREVTWIASAMTEEDVAAADERSEDELDLLPLPVHHRLDVRQEPVGDGDRAREAVGLRQRSRSRRLHPPS